MRHQRLTILLRDDEVAALLKMAAAQRRPPKQQVQWLVAKAATEAGLLENETGDGATVKGATVTRIPSPSAVA